MIQLEQLEDAARAIHLAVSLGDSSADPTSGTDASVLLEMLAPIVGGKVRAALLKHQLVKSSDAMHDTSTSTTVTELAATDDRLDQARQLDGSAPHATRKTRTKAGAIKTRTTSQA